MENNIVDIIDMKLREHPEKDVLVMSPVHLAELREYLGIEIEDDLKNYRGCTIAINEDVNDIRLL